jgi:hypothetical protein
VTSQPSPDDRPATLLEVERLQRGLLDPAAAALVEARVAAHGDPGADLPTDATVFEADPPERFLRNVVAARAEAAASTVSWRRRVFVLAPVLVVASLVMVVSADLIPEDPTRPDILLKAAGPPVLVVFRAGVEGAERLVEGQEVAEGDRLQLALQASGHTHGVLFSVDGHGVVTVHYRFSGDTPPPGELVLEAAYQLDDAPDFEAFHLLVSVEPFEDAALLELARRPDLRRGGPPVPDNIVKTSLVLSKAAR